MKTSRQAGSTNVVANLLAAAERASQRVSEASQKEVHNFFQEETSSPDGPAAPTIRRIVKRISTPSKLTKNDWMERRRQEIRRRQQSRKPWQWLKGYFSCKISLTVEVTQR